MSLINKLKERLAKTRANIFGRLSQVLVGKSALDEKLLAEIEEILITADIGTDTSHKILEQLRRRNQKEKTEDPSLVFTWLEEEIEKLIVPGYGLSFEKNADHHKPFVVLVVGVNGTGKTTTVGKLAHRFSKSGKKVLLAAGDTFRAAASGQLEIWAQRSGVEILRQHDGADPAAVVFDAMAMAQARGFDVVLVDTAGRLHTKRNLMEELKKIKRVIEKQIPDAPHETVLVLDGTTGQNAIQQARQFSQAVPVTALIVTKLDGTAKGGVVLAIQQELKIPVRYIGIGESLEDLVEFDPSDFIRAIIA
jgi:fused signal recognition particle receptor